MARMDKVGKTATHIGSDNGMNYVQYHATKVVQWDDKQIILDSGGWNTVTTKARMNQASLQFDLGFGVYQEDFAWYVVLDADATITLDFTDGMVINR